MQTLDIDRIPGRNIPLPPSPFNKRREVSADAKYIVRHLYFILVLLPVVLAVLIVLARS